MATTTVSSRDLAGTNSILFIRPQIIRIDILDARPNTRLYPFFDGVRIDELIAPAIVPSSMAINLPHAVMGMPPALDERPYGYPIVTNEIGRCAAYFKIPGGRFNTGEREIIFADTPDLGKLDVVGNVYGFAKATFTSNGIQEIYQKTTINTTTTINEVVQVRTVNLDPLAQSFFTFGVSGGLFLTSIDLFFQSKDDSTPVSIEIRPLINGVPGPLVGPDATDRIARKSASDVLISDDASVKTNFKFNTPIYLPEDGEFCFVVRSNSNNYNIWTSKLGERSIESGYIIHEQPYVGSLFKSENNITWTAEQFEDIKFNINRAEFDISGAASLRFVGNSPDKSIKGSRFNTTAGSNLVVVDYPEMHGLSVGSKIAVAGDVGASYNGISAADMTGYFDVTRKIDDYFVEFACGAPATSSGPIDNCNIIRHIAVTNGGSGYTSPPLVTIGAPLSGTTATATAVVLDGRVVRVDIVDPGIGYTSNVSVLFSGVGVGAAAVAITEATFTVTTNSPFEWVSPQFRYNVLPGTKISANIDSCNPSYGFEPTFDTRIDQLQRMEETRLVASRINEVNSLAGDPSFSYNMELSSTISTLSPIIDMRGSSSLLVYANAINNQSRDESVNILTTDASGHVESVFVTSAGTGYSTAPTVTVIPAENDKNKNNINPATITASVAGGVVTGLMVTTPGSGYTQQPTIAIAAPSSGTGATANCEISTFNSELATVGSSYSRYLTRKIRLETVSSGIRLFVLAHSTPETTFDWYIRTSLSSDVTTHEDADWRLMVCDIPRDRSSSTNQFFEYKFYLDDIPSFDVYDMKMVPCSINRARIPFIKKYRSIVVV